jgi:hypothetical protein
MALWKCEAELVAIENPVGIMSRVFRKPDQYIQPWQFGHGETKKTGLWLRGLPKLTPTDIVDGREPRVHHMAPGPNRWRERSRTYQGIANAMAEQWGAFERCSECGEMHADCEDIQGDPHCGDCYEGLIYCPTCGGSGGGEGYWRCTTCSRGDGLTDFGRAVVKQERSRMYASRAR